MVDGTRGPWTCKGNPGGAAPHAKNPECGSDGKRKPYSSQLYWMRRAGTVVEQLGPNGRTESGVKKARQRLEGYGCLGGG